MHNEPLQQTGRRLPGEHVAQHRATGLLSGKVVRHP
jgi:hypothetical protein